VQGGVNLPQLLEANAVRLWLTVGAQVEFIVQLLGQVTMATLRKDGALAMQLHASLKAFLQTLTCYMYKQFQIWFLSLL
jgi:hypothetical protein